MGPKVKEKWSKKKKTAKKQTKKKTNKQKKTFELDFKVSVLEAGFITS